MKEKVLSILVPPLGSFIQAHQHKNTLLASLYKQGFHGTLYGLLAIGILFFIVITPASLGILLTIAAVLLTLWAFRGAKIFYALLKIIPPANQDRREILLSSLEFGFTGTMSVKDFANLYTQKMQEDEKARIQNLIENELCSLGLDLSNKDDISILQQFLKPDLLELAPSLQSNLPRDEKKQATEEKSKASAPSLSLSSWQAVCLNAIRNDQNKTLGKNTEYIQIFYILHKTNLLSATNTARIITCGSTVTTAILSLAKETSLTQPILDLLFKYPIQAQLLIKKYTQLNKNNPEKAPIFFKTLLESKEGKEGGAITDVFDILNKFESLLAEEKHVIPIIIDLLNDPDSSIAVKKYIVDKMIPNNKSHSAIKEIKAFASTLNRLQQFDNETYEVYRDRMLELLIDKKTSKEIQELLATFCSLIFTNGLVKIANFQISIIVPIDAAKAKVVVDIPGTLIKLNENLKTPPPPLASIPLPPQFFAPGLRESLETNSTRETKEIKTDIIPLTSEPKKPQPEISQKTISTEEETQKYEFLANFLTTQKCIETLFASINTLKEKFLDQDSVLALKKFLDPNAVLTLKFLSLPSLSDKEIKTSKPAITEKKSSEKITLDKPLNSKWIICFLQALESRDISSAKINLLIKASKISDEEKLPHRIQLYREKIILLLDFVVFMTSEKIFPYRELILNSIKLDLLGSTPDLSKLYDDFKLYNERNKKRLLAIAEIFALSSENGFPEHCSYIATLLRNCDCSTITALKDLLTIFFAQKSSLEKNGFESLLHSLILLNTSKNLNLQTVQILIIKLEETATKKEEKLGSSKSTTSEATVIHNLTQSILTLHSNNIPITPSIQKFMMDHSPTEIEVTVAKLVKCVKRFEFLTKSSVLMQLGDFSPIIQCDEILPSKKSDEEASNILAFRKILAPNKDEHKSISQNINAIIESNLRCFTDILKILSTRQDNLVPDFIKLLNDIHEFEILSRTLEEINNNLETALLKESTSTTKNISSILRSWRQPTPTALQKSAPPTAIGAFTAFFFSLPFAPEQPFPTTARGRGTPTLNK